MSFGPKSTAEEVTQGIDLFGKVAIVTGGNSGIGAETVRVLALRGAHVIMGCRNLAAGETVKASVIKAIPSAKVEVMELDLASLASVRAFTNAYKAKNYPLNILINNAAVMATPFSTTNDGYELQFQTNHLGHFLLTNELLDILKASAKKSGTESRIVNVSSVLHARSYPEGIRADNINDPNGYDVFLAYGQSKLANVLHARELSRRLKAEGANVTANSLHPGVIKTGLTRYYANWWLVGIYYAMMNYTGRLKTIPQGAATQVYVATNPAVAGATGEYFNNCQVEDGSPQSQDPSLALKLWEISEKMVALKTPK
eukprot:TRINITY_DN18157_c0_g1_i1.p1 TRINITY_DN18157_c0_g1~~TRINITY_DN18157_c0_g1_i1.p1  ORF type:complete len:314 (+),score=50.10 TRINITY_DN18157_c0_g1_i1:394-1335(+)